MMEDFDGILEACLNDLRSGVSTLDECLARYPKHAPQLGPLLRAAGRLERTGKIGPSAAFKARTRAKLKRHAQTNPHPKRRTFFVFQLSPQKLAFSFLVVVLTFLVAGTAYAQNALPGSSFYAWKYTSERVWRAVSLDPIGTDINFLNRRTSELIAVSRDPDLGAKALERYWEAENQLKSTENESIELRILPAVERNHQALKQSGIPVEK